MSEGQYIHLQSDAPAKDSEILTKEEFCARFKAYMLRAVGETDANGDSVADYADETAPTYWDEPWQRKLGPEQCAQADLDEWEPAE